MYEASLNLIDFAFWFGKKPHPLFLQEVSVVNIDTIPTVILCNVVYNGLKCFEWKLYFFYEKTLIIFNVKGFNLKGDVYMLYLH